MPLHLKSAPTKTFADTAQQDVAERVRGIIGDIRENGDAAVRRYAEQFDNWSPESYRLSDAEIEQIIGTLSPQVIQDIEFVQTQVRRFAQAQRDSSSTSRSRPSPASSWARSTSPCRRPVRTSPAESTRSRHPHT